MNNRSQNASESTIEINMYFAKQAICYVHRTLPFGSINRKSDESRANYTEALERFAQANRAENEETKRNPMLSQAEVNDIFKEFGVGNCGQQVFLAFRFLKDLGLQDLEIVHTQKTYHHTTIRNRVTYDRHGFLVIGGNVICDPWDKMAYPIMDFDKQREIIIIVRYAEVVYNEYKTEGYPPPIEFLAGQLYSAAKISSQSCLSNSDKFQPIEKETTTGNGKALNFLLQRFSFLGKLEKCKIQEVKDNTHRELKAQSEQLKKF
jgi:hypothetical protein